jgi:glycosyltransferase involved in cell wall biosynthesis
LDIVYVSHYFPPEVNAPAVRVSELARHWQRRGHRVTVLTGFPNHPTGIIPAGYRGRRLAVENYGGVRVIRTWVYAAANKGFLRRTLNYLSFLCSALLVGGRQIGPADVVIGTSPQIFVAVAAWRLARRRKARFVFEVRDIWPEEIEAVGAVRNRFVLRLLERLEMFLYRKADRIVAVAQGTVDTLVARGVPQSKLVLVPNGVDLGEWADGERGKARRRLGLGDEFVVSYIGTHGMAHRLDTVLDAAAELSSIPDLRVLMVGDGAERRRLELRARERRLEHVQFRGQVARDLVRDFYAASDVCLVPLRRADLFTRNVPSKIYEIMAAGKPVVIGTEGESRALVEKAGCGVAVEPENAHELAEAIRALHNRREWADELGRSGRRFVEAHNDRGHLADAYLKMLHTLTRKTRASAPAPGSAP